VSHAGVHARASSVIGVRVCVEVSVSYFNLYRV